MCYVDNIKIIKEQNKMYDGVILKEILKNAEILQLKYLLRRIV